MADATYEPPVGYMTMVQAQGALKISKATMHRMVKAGRLATYDDPRNARVKLVRAADVQALLEPRPRFRAA